MFIYCTYLTFYSGSKLPPFYIGSTSVNKIKSGYHGSVTSKEYISIYKSELKQNPQLFKTKILRTFGTRTEAYASETKLQKQLDVVKSPMYFNKSFANGKFGMAMVGKTHPMYGKKLSQETKDKISKSLIGRTHTQESKLKMSESQKSREPRSLETRLKMSKAFKGRTHTQESKLKMSESQKSREPRSLETRLKLSEAALGKKHTNEARIKMSQAKLGTHNKPKTCPHCGKTGGNNMLRYHFDNCKFKI